jgi:hypothetical protein
MSVKYEMQIKLTSYPDQEWRSFDTRKTIEELNMYDTYKRHSRYDARIIKITTTREVVKK